MLCDASISTLASTCASGDSGMWDRHLVAVEVGIECGADERVNFDGFTFHQHRLECLNAQAVKGWGAV
jgi:hypothetical protein